MKISKIMLFLKLFYTFLSAPKIDTMERHH